MGGKTATTTQQVQIPKEVMDRYRSVNVRAEQAATQPFQAYSQDPSAFVAPLTATQQAGIQNINQAAGMTQPYFNTAAGMTMAGAQGVGPLTQQQIGYYQNPFTQSVVDATRAGLQQLQGQQLAQQQAEAIRAGAFGGDRAGIQRAQLMGQQGLATAQAISPLYQQAYQQAVQTAMGQQGVAAQDLQRQLAAGQQLGGLGAAAQQAALQGAQAQLGAGAQQQQTEQAGLSALYNQFLQERGYPFQVAQFLANIAMGTGALSGSTTTTAQPVPFFSDLRNKRNVQVLGRDPDSGNLIIAYDDKDDLEKSEMHGSPMPPKRVGPIAQELEAQYPELVSEVGGHKIVKGLAPESMGGPVIDLPPGEYREHKADGGGLAALYAQFGSPYGPQQGMQEGPYGARAGYLKSGLNPPGRIAFQADTRQVKPVSTIMQEAMQGAGNVNAISGMFDPEKSVTGKLFNKGLAAVQGAAQGSTNPPDQTVNPNEPSVYGTRYASGGLVGYADGGEVDKDDPMSAYGAQGAGIGIPTEMKQPPKLQTPGAPSSSGAGGLGAGSQLLGAAGAVNTLATAGSTIAEALPALMAFLPSDERMKDNVEQVGELYDGQPVYRYNMKGSPRTQLGLVAQDVERSGHGDAVAGLGGIKMVDYKRATDVAAGLAPRQGYADGGMPDEEYAIRTIAAEMSGKSPEEARAIARVIENRRATGRWGDTYQDVVMARNQFEPWNNPTGRNYPMNIRENDPRLAMAREAYAARAEGEDPTGGALHFWAPAAQRALGRAAPSWDNEDATMIGATRFVRNVDGSNARAYAGERSRGEGADAIERQAGPARGLAGARQQEPQRGGLFSPPIKSGTRSEFNPEGKQFDSWADFLTSKQFIIPALTGLGAMASSPSLFAGSAMLQGLGAGAQAYSNLEKREADLARSEAETSQVREQTSEVRQLQQKGDLFMGPTGPMVLMPGGRQIPIGQWVAEGRPPTRSQSREKPSTPRAPGTPAPGTPAPGTPPAGGGAAPANLPEPITNLAKENAEYVQNTRIEGLARDKETNDPFTPANAIANRVYGNRMQTMAFAKALSDLPAGGPITAEIINPFKQRALDLLKIAGVPDRYLPDLKNDVSAVDIANKVRNSLATSGVRGPAVEELNRVFNSIPGDINSKDGQAQLISSFLVEQQEAREKARMFNDYRRYMEKTHGVTSEYSQYSGRGLNDAFEASMRQRYQDDKANLSKMFNDFILGRDRKPAPVLNGKPATVMSYLIANSGKITDKNLEKALIAQYGEENLRRAQQYFGG